MNKKLRILAVLLVLVLLGGGLVAGQSTKQLAQKYRNANPGESFTVGCITWWLGQEYAIMVYQAVEQAAKQMGLKFRGAVASTESDWIELTESMIAAGAKAIVYNVPNMAVMKQVADIANQNKVFIATYFGYTGDILPGDYGPYWVIDNTPFSDEQTFIPLTLLMQKMKEAGKNKLLIHQASKSAATVSTVYINLGIYQALQKYPEMKLSGFQYGEWGFEPGRAAAEASLAMSKDYQGMWGANDGQTMGALKALKDRGLNIGAFSASRDMELTTAQEIMKGNFLCTSGFAIPYFGGRLVPMLYDMCVGEWYPAPDEMLQTGTLDLYGRPGELEKLAKERRHRQAPELQHGSPQGEHGADPRPDEGVSAQLPLRLPAAVPVEVQGAGPEIRPARGRGDLPRFSRLLLHRQDEEVRRQRRGGAQARQGPSQVLPGHQLDDGPEGGEGVREAVPAGAEDRAELAVELEHSFG